MCERSTLLSTDPQQRRVLLELPRKPINRASNFDLRSQGRHPLVRHPGGVTLLPTTLRGISYVTRPWSPAASALEMLSNSSLAAAPSLDAARTRKDKGTAEAMFIDEYTRFSKRFDTFQRQNYIRFSIEKKTFVFSKSFFQLLQRRRKNPLFRLELFSSRKDCVLIPGTRESESLDTLEPKWDRGNLCHPRQPQRLMVTGTVIDSREGKFKVSPE